MLRLEPIEHPALRLSASRFFRFGGLLADTPNLLACKGARTSENGLPLADLQRPCNAPSASRFRFGATCSHIEIGRWRSVGLNFEPSLIGFIAGDEKTAPPKRPGFGSPVPVSRRGIVGCVVAGSLAPARQR